eukprot:scaffold3418_cov124-Isochrysis_galbana.AAC.39
MGWWGGILRVNKFSYALKREEITRTCEAGKRTVQAQIITQRGYNSLTPYYTYTSAVDKAPPLAQRNATRAPPKPIAAHPTPHPPCSFGTFMSSRTSSSTASSRTIPKWLTPCRPSLLGHPCALGIYAPVPIAVFDAIGRVAEAAREGARVLERAFRPQADAGQDGGAHAWGWQVIQAQPTAAELVVHGGGLVETQVAQHAEQGGGRRRVVAAGRAHQRHTVAKSGEGR